MITKRLRQLAGIFSTGALLTSLAVAAETSPPSPAPVSAAATSSSSDESSSIPALYIAGDSTAASGIQNAIGWGKMVGEYFDPAKIRVLNKSIGGRSSRTFVSEGHWEKIVADLKAGDTVIIQFGQNDGAEMNGERIARGSLPGLGEETQEIDNKVTKQHEVVHTFGWYMRKMIAETRAKGAAPILYTLTVRNLWKDGKVERGAGQYDEWIHQLAEAEKVPLVDHTKLVADRFEQIGQVAANANFPKDHVHTGDDGARMNAFFAVSGLKGLREQPLIRTLSLAGRLVPTATPANVWVPVQPPPRGTGPDRSAFATWLNTEEPADLTLPTIWLIGDSTVRNGKGNGYDGQFGWGDPLANYFYPTKANLVNRAIGGTGARSYRVTWEKILPLIKAKDVVILQFGHNDNGPRGPLPGIGEETEERENPTTKEKETIHTFGWYLRRYVAEGREKGATVVICSLVPRNNWKDGKIDRPANSHAAWAKSVADAEKAPFLDLNNLIADQYDPLGEEKVTALFADKKVHTGWMGAEMSAKIVADALRALPQNPVREFMRPGM